MTLQGLIGRKVGMTQVFNTDGDRIVVTVIEGGPCSVVQRKTTDRDGYDSVQLGFGEQKEHRVSKAAMSRFRKAGTGAKRVLREFRVDAADEIKAGDLVGISIFEGATHVDVTGVSKGQGFQGVMKRYGMRGGPMTHGGCSKRRIGSIGSNSYPARVAKGKRMPGHAGNRVVTQQNLEVVELRNEDNLILVRGAVPGANGSFVLIRKAFKKAART